MILKGISVKGREKKDNEAMIAWDAGVLETLSLCKGEHMCYKVYFKEEPYKTDYSITGNNEELIAFIDKLATMTDKEK